MDVLYSKCPRCGARYTAYKADQARAYLNTNRRGNKKRVWDRPAMSRGWSPP